MASMTTTLKTVFPVFDRQGHVSWLKSLALAALLVPVLHLAWRALQHDLGPLPYKEALHVTGDWALRFLVATLVLTPAMRIFNWPKLALIRRMTGVGTFCYAALHFILHIANSNFDLKLVATEIFLRIYLLIGFVALIGLTALAVTSTDGAVRKLGQKWKSLHKLVYWITPVALVHAFMQYKVDVSPAVLLAGFFSTLMIYRFMLKRKLPFNWLNLAIAAVAGAVAAAGFEFLWYAVATGVSPWRVLKANVMLGFGLRPAAIVLLSGLAVTGLALLVPFVRARLGSSTKPVPARAKA